MMRYTEVLPKLFQILVEFGLVDDRGPHPKVDRGLIVRDLKGRVRLVLDWAVDRTTVESVEAKLNHELEGWFAGTILRPQDGADTKRLASQLFEAAKKPRPEAWGWTYESPAGDDVVLPETRWFGLQRTLSKQAWLTSTPIQPPWPLLSKTPTLVSFYSYKGGVGRSTLVGLVAAHLADRGQKVVVVDLDLEAPGQHNLLNDVDIEGGVLDFVVEHLALGRAQIERWVRRPPKWSPSDGKAELEFIPAGKVDASYLEMLARLDFATNDVLEDLSQSPVELALRDLLKQIKNRKPDWILLDARTGLHDLGGLALHALSHIDVLVGRSNPQDEEGLAWAIRVLARRSQAVAEGRLILVQNMASADAELRQLRLQRAKEHFHDIMVDTVYSVSGDAELLDVNDDGPHHPFPVILNPDVAQIGRLFDLPQSFAFSDSMRRIVSRLEELIAEPEDE